MVKTLLCFFACTLLSFTSESYSQPQIISFSPTSAGPGKTVVITGSNFENISGLSIGGIPVTEFTVDSPTQISVTIGSQASGAIAVISDLGSASIDGFVFSPTTTQVQESQCGITLAALGTPVSAVCKPNATAYRFSVTNLSTGNTQYIIKGLQYFSLNMLASYEYATTYTIRVEVQINGVWQGVYGDACLISTPAVLSPNGAAQIQSAQCGTKLSNISQLISTTSLAGVTGYRFRVTNESVPFSEPQIIDRGLQWFSLPMLANYNYGANYKIEVAIKTTDEYSEFGSPCYVSSPDLPMLVSCGAAIEDSRTMITTNSLSRVISYRFEVTNLDTFQTITIDRGQNWFSFSQIPDYIPGAAYGVRIALLTGNSYSEYGDACEIYAPSGAAREISDLDKPSAPEVNLVASPNPFNESFSISSESEGVVSVKTYDMTGRLIESKTIEGSSLENCRFGQNYPSGVYNVLITQGEEFRTLRMIKR